MNAEERFAWKRPELASVPDPDRIRKERPGKLTPEQRRALVLEVLSDPERSKTEIADEYGISRTRLYSLLAEAMADPAGSIDEAVKELLFRSRVARLLGV